MASAPQTTVAVRELVIAVFSYLWMRQGGKPEVLPKGTAVLIEVARRMNESDSPDRIPSERMVQKILEGPREQARQLRPIDAPWTLGWSMDGGAPDPFIPPEAIPDLLQLKKHFMLLGFTFTVRLARWAAKIRMVPRIDSYGSALPHARRISNLFHLSENYANRQRLAELTGAALDTADLDEDMTLEHHLRMAVESTANEFPSRTRPSDLLHQGRNDVNDYDEPEIAIEYLLQPPGREDRQDELELKRQVASLMATVPPQRKQPILDLWLFWIQRLFWQPKLEPNPIGLAESGLPTRLLERLIACEADERERIESFIFTMAERDGIDPPTLLAELSGTRDNGIPPEPYVPTEFFDEIKRAPEEKQNG
jgi:hypothetical protein